MLLLIASQPFQKHHYHISLSFKQPINISFFIQNPVSRRTITVISKASIRNINQDPQSINLVKPLKVMGQSCSFHQNFYIKSESSSKLSFFDAIKEGRWNHQRRQQFTHAFELMLLVFFSNSYQISTSST